jgi:hypothetical protein
MLQIVQPARRHTAVVDGSTNVAIAAQILVFIELMPKIAVAAATFTVPAGTTGVTALTVPLVAEVPDVPV